MQYGLFQVHDRIFQVRGYDLSNITFIQGDTGWIVFDPLISAETAKAALDLVTQHLGQRPIVAVIYSHSHVDHYGGVRGVVDEADVKSGKVQILAPEHFTEHAISENVIAGNAMSRRAIYMYGALLPRNAQGGVNGGLGQTTSTGTSGLIEPTREIKKTGEEVVDRRRAHGVPDDARHRGAGRDEHLLPAVPRHVDGRELDQHAAQRPDAARRAGARSAEMGELPQRDDRALRRQDRREVPGPSLADVGQRQDHRLLEEAPRPVQVHARPVGEPDEQGLHRHRNLQHGQAAAGARQAMVQPRLLRHGASTTRAPSISATWASTTASRDARPVAAGRRRQEIRRVHGRRGGDPAKAKADFDKGEYRWVAEALKHVVFADPNNKDAKELLADAYEQMGYQAESGPWRSVYLQGAFELRNGVPTLAVIVTASPDTISAMPPEMLFDYLGVRLNGENAAGKKLTLNSSSPT